MRSGGFRFDRFRLDPADRRLWRDEAPVELNARYLDALALLVGEAGRLVSKQRFLEEVWRGVPVTDEALTQCIRTLRRQLGDDAASPRFIETVPKHGYRFIAEVESANVECAAVETLPLDGGSTGADIPRTSGDGITTIASTRRIVHPTFDPSPSRDSEPSAAASYSWREVFLLGGAGTVGAGIAGAIGGLAYGFAGASQPLGPGMGAASVLVVLLWLTIAAALMGGAGVSFGIAAAGLARGPPWCIAGGALGGLIVGGAVKLVGLDAFNLLLGQSPGDITGAAEGAVLGGAVGLGAWLATRRGEPPSLGRPIALAAAAGAAAGIVIPLLGGRMMAGSLDLLADAFPESQLRLDAIGALFGENGLGPVGRIVTGAIEGALFAAGIVGAMTRARRRLAGGARTKEKAG